MLTEILDKQHLLRALDSSCLPVYWLEELAAHDDPEIRIAVADHPNSTPDLIWALAKDDNPDVRYAIAENHNTALDILEMLTSDDNPYVVHRAQRTLARLRGGTIITITHAFEKMSNGFCGPTLRPIRQF